MFYLFIYLFISLFVYLFVYVFIYVFIYLFVYLVFLLSIDSFEIEFSLFAYLVYLLSIMIVLYVRYILDKIEWNLKIGSNYNSRYDIVLKFI